jgi:hypothetical protein
MTAATDSHLESGPDTPVVGPQLYHQVTLHALHLLHRRLPWHAPPSPPAATADGVLTPTRNRLSTPVSRPDAAEGGTRVRPVSLRSCAHVRVPWIRAGGRTERRYLQTLSGCRVQYSVTLGTGSTGLEKPVCDPSLSPGTGVAQRDRSQSLPACEEASATSAPPQHHRRAGTASLARIHTPVTCTIPQACDILGQPAGSHRSSTERGALGAAWTARVSC